MFRSFGAWNVLLDCRNVAQQFTAMRTIHVALQLGFGLFDVDFHTSVALKHLNHVVDIQEEIRRKRIEMLFVLQLKKIRILFEEKKYFVFFLNINKKKSINK